MRDLLSIFWLDQLEGIGPPPLRRRWRKVEEGFTNKPPVFVLPTSWVRDGWVHFFTLMIQRARRKAGSSVRRAKTSGTGYKIRGFSVWTSDLGMDWAQQEVVCLVWASTLGPLFPQTPDLHHVAGSSTPLPLLKINQRCVNKTLQFKCLDKVSVQIRAGHRVGSSRGIKLRELANLIKSSI